MNYSVITNNTSRVKQSNTELVKNSLRKLGSATRNEIARDTELSVATCGNILKKLIATNEALEDEFVYDSGGRPARKYQYNKNYSLLLCITLQSDASQKSLNYVVTNLNGEVIEENTSFYDYINFDIIDMLVGKLIAEHQPINSIGIGIPGITDKDGKILANDIVELNDIPLVSKLENKYRIKTSSASSGALTALGYYKNHPEHSGKTLAALVAPKNHLFGAGIVINGNMFKGDKNSAGELDYIYNSNTISKNHRDTLSDDSIVTALTALIAVLAPSVIVLTGQHFNEEIFQNVTRKCKEIIPKAYLPIFELKIDAAKDYQAGVINMALDSLSPNIQLISI